MPHVLAFSSIFRSQTSFIISKQRFYPVQVQIDVGVLLSYLPIDYRGSHEILQYAEKSNALEIIGPGRSSSWPNPFTKESITRRVRKWPPQATVFFSIQVAWILPGGNRLEQSYIFRPNFAIFSLIVYECMPWIQINPCPKLLAYSMLIINIESFRHGPIRQLPRQKVICPAPKWHSDRQTDVHMSGEGRFVPLTSRATSQSVRVEVVTISTGSHSRLSGE